jgi:hypothetical protein
MADCSKCGSTCPSPYYLNGKPICESCFPRSLKECRGTGGKNGNRKKKVAADRPKTVKKKRPRKHKNTDEQKVEYGTYMNSAAWRDLSKKFRDAIGKCQICGTDKSLQCHHLHYRTLGRETLEDILVVCLKCHCNLHGVKKFKKKRK